MTFICDEMWNNVEVFGTWTEIDRFRMLCIIPAPTGNFEGSTLAIDFSGVAGTLRELRLIPSGWGVDTWDLRARSRQGAGYAFAFDMVSRFPAEDMEDLARLFPLLAFHCECIADNDSSIGYGWFNTPAGGQDFFAGYHMPRNYLTTGSGHKRGRADQRRHVALMQELERRFSGSDGFRRTAGLGRPRGEDGPFWAEL